MPSFRDITGETFGYLTVVRRVENQGAYVCWEAKCVCGSLVVKQARSITLNATGSCGCKTSLHTSQGVRTHAQSNTPTYKSWAMMKSRCLNPNYTHYGYYGGKGVTIHQPWVDSYDAFVQDMGERPDGTTLDRISSDGDYTPENCRWATSSTQSDNKTSSLTYSYNGENLSLNEIAKRTGTKRAKLYSYLYRGYSLDLAILFSR